MKVSLRPVADAVREDLPEGAPLLVRELDLVVGPIERFQVATHDVVGERAPGYVPGCRVGGIDLAARAGALIGERLHHVHSPLRLPTTSSTTPRVPAVVRQAGRLRSYDLLRKRDRLVIGLNVGQPTIHLPEEHTEIRSVFRVAPAPADVHYVVVRVPIGGDQTGTCRELVDDHVDISTLTIVRVTPVVDHRSRRQPGTAVEDSPGVHGSPGCLGVGPMPLGHMIEIGVVPSDIPIEGDELGLRDLAAVQDVEAVLHAVIVQRTRRETGRGVDTVDVHGMVVHSGPDPVRVRRAITESFQLGAAAHLRALLLRGRRLRVGGVDPCRATAQVGDAPPGAEAGNQALLVFAKLAWSHLGEVEAEQARVGQGEDRGRGHIRKTGRDDDAVEHAGVIVGRLMALVRTARAPRGDRVGRLAVALDEALLDHDVGLGGQKVVAVGSEHVQRRGSDRESHLEQPHVEYLSSGAPLLEPTVPTPATVGVHELSVPTAAAGPGVRRGIRGVVEHRALIDRTVDRPGLDSDDERHDLAVQGRRFSHVGRHRTTVRLEPPVVLRRQIHVLDPCLDGAVLVERGAERLTARCPEPFGPAEVGRLVGPGDDRTRDRVVREL